MKIKLILNVLIVLSSLKALASEPLSFQDLQEKGFTLTELNLTLHSSLSGVCLPGDLRKNVFSDESHLVIEDDSSCATAPSFNLITLFEIDSERNTLQVSFSNAKIRFDQFGLSWGPWVVFPTRYEISQIIPLKDDKPVSATLFCSVKESDSMVFKKLIATCDFVELDEETTTLSGQIILTEK